MDQRKFSAFTQLAGNLGNFDDNNNEKSGKESKAERKAREKEGVKKNPGGPVKGGGVEDSKPTQEIQPIYTTKSYNSLKNGGDSNSSELSEETFKNYYAEDKKPAVLEKVFEDYQLNEQGQNSGGSSLVGNYKPSRKLPENYLGSQEYSNFLKFKENLSKKRAHEYLGKMAVTKKLFPNWDKKNNEYDKGMIIPGTKGLDQMGFVENKKDIELQEIIYKEVDHWRNELNKKYEDKKKNNRNKKELEEFNKNPYDWTRIALSNQLTRLRNDLEKSTSKKDREVIRKKINDKEKILNTVTNAIQKKMPLIVDSQFASDGIVFENGKSLDVEVVTDIINKMVDKDSLNYSVVGVVLRGRDKFVVLKNEKNERVELKMEDAERLAGETSLEFKKSKEKEKKLEGISVGDIIKVRTGGLDGEKALYKIREVKNGKVSFENLTANQKGSMGVEDMRNFLMDKNREFVVEKSAEYKNKEELRSLEYFNEKIEELKIRQTIGRRNASPEEKAKIWKKQLIELGFGDVEISLADQVEDNEKIEAEKKERVERQKIMREMSEIIRKNGNKIDKLVIHGYTYEDEEQNLNSHWDADLDTRGSLFLLDLAKIDYNLVEKTHKGTAIEPEAGKVVSYEDVGGRTLGIEYKNGGIQQYNDHHQRGYSGRKDSATKQRYQQLFENGFIKREPWLDNFVDFINQQDNLTYVDDSRFKGNEKYFRNKFPTSLFALQKEVDFEQVVKWFKEGKDPFNPNFSDRELEQKVMYKKEMIPLKFVIGEIQKKVDSDLKSFEFAKRKMKERGIKEQTDELGKVVYNFPDFQTFIGSTKGKVVNKFNYPFLIVKAKGYDTYVSYSELTKKYFINNSTHDLTFIDRELTKKIPENIMVNGVMILPPKKKADREVINEEEFLKIIKLKE